MANYLDGAVGYSHLFDSDDLPSKPVCHPFFEGQFEEDDDETEKIVHVTVESEKSVNDFSVLEKPLPQSPQITNGLPTIVPNNTGKEDMEKTIFHTNDNWDYEEDSDDQEDYDDNFLFWDERHGPNSQAVRAMNKNFQTSDELFRKISSKINIEKFEGVENLPTGAGNKILTKSKKAMSQGVKLKDKQDRATVEQVLDPRTRMILYKLLHSGKIVSIDGCISTGKEANVYHATGPENAALAIKIFKTSILTFKARDKYVTGEFRFRQGYCKKNPRKMVRLWAEKEFRNLIRIHACGLIKVPHPKILKSHVLVMDFIGENGWPSPLLKDVKFDDLELEVTPDEKNSEGVSVHEDRILQLFTDLYRQCLLILYRLFKHCKLVHADFSEFNLILKNYKELYVIDVSQSVEHDHPRSFDFLRHDIKNVQDYFGKHILVGDYQEIFEFITSPNVDDSNYEAVLDNILKGAKKLESFNVSDEVFRQTHIPRKMQEIVDYEHDYEKLKKGDTDLMYTKVMGMKPDMSGPETIVLSRNKSALNTEDADVQVEKLTIVGEEKENLGKDGATEDNVETESDSDSGTANCEDDEDDKSKNSTAVRPKNETLEEKRLRKKQVKEDKAEKRKTKVKKHVKKRKEKLAHANSKK